MIEKYFKEVNLDDIKPYDLLLKEYPDYINQIEDSVEFFIRANPLNDINEACELVRCSIYLLMFG